MRREEVLHVARAAADVAGVRRVLIVGGQAVLGSFHEHELPREATASLEADVIVIDDPSGDAAHKVEGALGFMSAFERQNTYYADGVVLDEVTMPDGWEGRVLSLTTDGHEGEVEVLFPEVHDLCIGKLVANRPHDRTFVQALCDAGVVDATLLVERAGMLSTVPSKQRRQTQGLAQALVEGRSIVARL